MALTITLANLRALCRLDSEIPDSITDAELLTWINQAAKELTAYLYDLDSRWAISKDTVTLDGSESYSLPTDLYKIELMYKGNPPNGVRLREITPSQIPLYTNSDNEYPAYYLSGSDTVYILPSNSTGTLNIWYVPTLAALSGDSDTFDGRFGWEDYICNRVGKRFAKRMAEDVAPWDMDLAEIKSRIASQMASVNLSEPRSRRNVEYERQREYNLRLWR